jgi:SAM-dependent methyltransferase
MANLSYTGVELELFEKAENWKTYFHDHIKKYLGPEILEVGAGIGATTTALYRRNHIRWLCLEPDPVLAARLSSLVDNHALPSICEIRSGVVADLPRGEMFDTLLYIDVLEHIEHDQAELESSSTHLKPGGFLVVLSPAHQSLYSAFDKAIGHHRRYNKETLSAVVPRQLKCVDLKYLDCIGAVASLANRFVIRSDLPNARQLRFWDKFMIPLSRVFDPLLGYRAGKSVLGVWEKQMWPT